MKWIHRNREILVLQTGKTETPESVTKHGEEITALPSDVSQFNLYQTSG